MRLATVTHTGWNVNRMIAARIPVLRLETPLSLEIERRFRVYRHPSDWDWSPVRATAWRITQGYVYGSPGAPELRLRTAHRVRVSDSPTDEPDEQSIIRRLGVKSDFAGGNSSLGRVEVELPISEENLLQLWPLVGDRFLRKIRTEYLAQIGETDMRVVVVDRYLDQLEGLVLAEIEFESVHSANTFDPPGFLGREVTNDLCYRGAALASARVAPR